MTLCPQMRKIRFPVFVLFADLIETKGENGDFCELPEIVETAVCALFVRSLCRIRKDLSRRRSRVRVSSAPPFLFFIFFWIQVVDFGPSASAFRVFRNLFQKLLRNDVHRLLFGLLKKVLDLCLPASLSEAFSYVPHVRCRVLWQSSANFGTPSCPFFPVL